MYWSDWGTVGKIERASMDGDDRMELINTDLSAPFGVTLDYSEQKVYWIDAALNKIEYCNTDGTRRITLTLTNAPFGLGTPYSLTLQGDYLYWSEWVDNSLYSVHKTEGGNVTLVLGGLVVNPNGIQAVGGSRRPYGEIGN